jgi:hypothetical protein
VSVGQALIVVLLLISTVCRAEYVRLPSQARAARVDVLVTDKGQPLPASFPATSSARQRVPQQVDLVNFDEIPLNVTLALDMSDSVAGEQLGRLRTAARGLLAALRPKDQAALITLSHIVQLRAGLTTDLESVRAALDKAQAVGETALVDGTYAGMMVGESDVGRSLLIVFSDGVDTSMAVAAACSISRRSDVVAYGMSAIAAEPRIPRDLTSITGAALRGGEHREPRKIFLGVENSGSDTCSATRHGAWHHGWHHSPCA